ncbi:DUF3422 domain-containing protein [Silicimonas algicola]|uniref:Putative membrane-anchored protein n=1 Tax=Silicimonas algicola TaxID=1826607 RepID=A0A316GDZ6_9RHOB|nr:DUF3422 domain-containing protein [Silicimonas algicola]AZQ66148.1 DUF3422 domain-containing protein [Silicimonas algicola]PWK58455.1 putative membrane-anchored protein [Silicimonas algicola]
MSTIRDHDLRYPLANELHARPFPALKAPCRAAFLAVKRPVDAAARDRDLDRAHLIELLDRFGAPHPQPGATHWFGEIGRHQLKWENHTEFVTYTIFGPGVADRPFDAATFSVFPQDWLDRAPGERITSALIRIEVAKDRVAIPDKLDAWFVPESLAASEVLDGEAVMAGDFRIDPAGHMRFALFVRPEMGERRTGRVVQRMCEIETYKTMSMLGLARSRHISPRLGAIDGELTRLMAEMSGDTALPEATLRDLLKVSAELETLLTRTSFRFGATTAYEALVHQRIGILRETRFGGRQTFAEFMMRRFDPAMRTVKATEARLASMADRATRAANLLRTRVDVERSAQNQALLASMDRRADLQLRLQHTVEGLSVVAISYYAVNLAGYVAYPLLEPAGMSKAVATAILTPLVVLLVWAMIRRIRKGMR